MLIKIHFENLEKTPWIESFLESKIQKLDRFLASSSIVNLTVRAGDFGYNTQIVVHHLNKDNVVHADGETLYESFTNAVDKSTRILNEEKRKVKDKMHRKYAESDYSTYSL